MNELEMAKNAYIYRGMSAVTRVQKRRHSDVSSMFLLWGEEERREERRGERREERGRREEDVRGEEKGREDV